MPEANTPGLLRRVAAMLYDGLLILALLFVAMAMVVIPMGIILGWENFDTASLRHNPLYIAYLLAVPLLFLTWFWTHGGQTLGMRAWRLRVVRADGGALTLRDGLVRYLAALLSWAALGLGFLWVLVDRERLAWHDRLSGTRLVKI